VQRVQHMLRSALEVSGRDEETHALHVLKKLGEDEIVPWGHFPSALANCRCRCTTFVAGFARLVKEAVTHREGEGHRGVHVHVLTSAGQASHGLSVAVGSKHNVKESFARSALFQAHQRACTYFTCGVHLGACETI
jgi:hypothetical protein